MLIYSAGLRRSELINLKVGDIDFERNQIWVRGGKGLKDRISLLSESLKPDLLSYMKIYKPKMYFIEGRDGFQYSVGSLRNILIEALKKTDIRKKVTLHTLDIALQLICLKQALLQDIYKIYWGIQVQKQQKFIRILQTRVERI